MELAGYCSNPLILTNDGRRTHFDEDMSDDELETSTRNDQKNKKNTTRDRKRLENVAILTNREAIISVSSKGDEDGYGERMSLVDPSSSSSEEDDEGSMSSISNPSRRRRRRKRRRKQNNIKPSCSENGHLNCFERYFLNTAPGLLEIVSTGGILDFVLNVMLRSVGQVTFCDVRFHLSSYPFNTHVHTYTHTHIHTHMFVYRIHGAELSYFSECLQVISITCSVPWDMGYSQ
jgi:hypothetical protein